MAKSFIKKMTSMLLAVSMLASVSVSAAAASLSNFEKVNDYTPGQFTDVPTDSWCAANVQTVYEYGLMMGKSGNFFDASGNLTVAQTIVMACRLHSIYMGDDKVFESATPWYQPYVSYALDEGIIESEYAEYNAPISRAAFAVILNGALPDEALKEISSIEDESIPDVSDDAGYFEAVYRLYRAGVLTGNDAKGTFAPYNHISRGAAAAILGRMANPTLRKEITLKQPPFSPVPVDQLANKKSLQKKCTDEEFQQAYDKAVELVTPYAKLSREEQLRGISSALRKMVDSGKVTYTTDVPHYNDPYGYFVAGVSSCAGCARATGLCLNVLGIPYEHVNENQWDHQWCRVKMDDGSYWICDAYGLYCGPEPAPYQHPYL